MTFPSCCEVNNKIYNRSLTAELGVDHESLLLILDEVCVMVLCESLLFILDGVCVTVLCV